MSSNKEIQFRSALSAMIDHIKSSVKNNLVEQCGKDFDKKDLQKIAYIADVSIAQAYVASAESVLRFVKEG